MKWLNYIPIPFVRNGIIEIIKAVDYVKKERAKSKVSAALDRLKRANKLRNK